MAAPRERLDMRIDPEEKALLERAASLCNQSLTAFVLASARRAAEEAISRREVLHLSARDTRAFVDALLNPPPFNARLKKALEYHASVVGNPEARSE